MRKLLTVTKFVLLASCAVSFIGTPEANAQKKWYLGIGTGLTRAHAQGDQGFNTVLFGPIEFEVDMDPSDFGDFTQSAVGLGGYATNGTWMLTGMFSKIKLGDDPMEDVPIAGGGGTYTSDLFFKTTTAEFTIGYVAFRSKNMKFNFTPYAGARYMKHRFVSRLTVTQGATTIEIMEEIDNDWTDFLIGYSFGFQLSPEVTLNAQADAGFGGSEGTYTYKASLTFKPSKRFSFSPNFKYASIEYENGARGDSDWYFYDANEFGFGMSFTLHL